MLPKVFIDGHVGTTGLRIREWLAGRDDIELTTLPDAQRKDAVARRESLRNAHLAILCLPNDATEEVASWVADTATRLIDASTAHRVSEEWVYGLPELMDGQRDAIRNAKLVSNPGCYASAFVLLLRPLVDAGIVSPATPVVAHALSGYSGGGRSLIERWEDGDTGLASLPYEAPYAFGCVHKHVPEMMKYARLEHEPLFSPAVGPFRCGMRVQVPLHAELFLHGADGTTAWETLAGRYNGEPFVKVIPLTDEQAIDERSLDPRACNDSNRIELRVIRRPSGHVVLSAVLDNLGKGACGMAIQSLNLMLGLPETKSLPI